MFKQQNLFKYNLEYNYASEKVKMLVTQSCLTLCDLVAHQAPLSMGFSRQEYWNGLPFSSPEDLPDPEIKPKSLTSPALALCHYGHLGKPNLTAKFILLNGDFLILQFYK